MNPLAIYDKLYEEGGGLVESPAFATSPTGIGQVKYQRAKFRDQHGKDTLAELIERCKELKGKFLHGLQVSPEVKKE